MIEYDKGRWGLLFILSLKGSVFPKSVAFALPCAIGSGLLCHLHKEDEDSMWWIAGWWGQSAIVSVWAGFTGVLGFLLVFRTQQAYARYWEGATLLRQARGQWFSSTSSLIAFCSGDEEFEEEVNKFQHCLVRMMSLLNCVALQTIADTESETFSVLATTGLDEEALDYLYSNDDKNQRCEILIQWIQRLVVNSMHNGVLDVPAPILTRFFQEMSVGFVNVTQARNLTDIPFPYPYSQMIQLMLIFHMLGASIVSALLLQERSLSSILTFALVFCFVGVNYIASEIEDPFGEDSNDLPLCVLQDDFNSSLWMLLDPKSQTPPSFEFDQEFHSKWSMGQTPSNAAAHAKGGYSPRSTYSKKSRGRRKRKSFYAGGKDSRRDSFSVSSSLPGSSESRRASSALFGSSSLPFNFSSASLPFANHSGRLTSCRSEGCIGSPEADKPLKAMQDKDTDKPLHSMEPEYEKKDSNPTRNMQFSKPELSQFPSEGTDNAAEPQRDVSFDVRCSELSGDIVIAYPTGDASLTCDAVATVARKSTRRSTNGLTKKIASLIGRTRSAAGAGPGSPKIKQMSSEPQPPVVGRASHSLPSPSIAPVVSWNDSVKASKARNSKRLQTWNSGDRDSRKRSTWPMSGEASANSGGTVRSKHAAHVSDADAEDAGTERVVDKEPQPTALHDSTPIPRELSPGVNETNELLIMPAPPEDPHMCDPSIFGRRCL